MRAAQFSNYNIHWIIVSTPSYLPIISRYFPETLVKVVVAADINGRSLRMWSFY